MKLKINPENYQKSTLSKTINKIKDNHLIDGEINNNLSQNEIINILEKDKQKEKDEKTIADYNYIIELIKNWFANKQSFNAQLAQKTIQNRINNEKILIEKLKEYKNKPLMLSLAKNMLGQNFVNYINNNFLQEKKQSMTLSRTN